jgi:hypothetical protein
MATLYVYGMRLRGFSPGAQPEEGWVDTETDPLDDYWNILVYNRQLTRKECEEYDLDFLGRRPTE